MENKNKSTEPLESMDYNLVSPNSELMAPNYPYILSSKGLTKHYGLPYTPNSQLSYFF